MDAGAGGGAVKDKRTKRQQAIDGAKYAGKLVLGFTIFVCLTNGVQILAKPEQRSRMVGGLLLVVALGALAYWVEIWRQWFPAFFAMGVMPSLFGVLTGHVRRGSNVVDRLLAADYFLFFLLSALLSAPYAVKKGLTILDKGALVLAAVSFAMAIVNESPLMLTLLPVVLLVPLVVQNFPRRRRKLAAHG